MSFLNMAIHRKVLKESVFGQTPGPAYRQSDDGCETELGHRIHSGQNISRFGNHQVKAYYRLP